MSAALTELAVDEVVEQLSVEEVAVDVDVDDFAPVLADSVR